MLSQYMKCNNTPRMILFHGTVASQQNQLAILPSKTIHGTWPNGSWNPTGHTTRPKSRSNPKPTLRVYLYLFLNKFGIKSKNKLVPNDLKNLCKLPYVKLVYQNKFHNFLELYSGLQKSWKLHLLINGLNIWTLKIYSNFKFLNLTRACTEDTQNFSEFLEL